MTPDGKKPTENKRYYDFFTWFVTQLAFSFTTTPFILLSIHDSMLAWARVYFYCIIGVTACSIFLVTPGKTYLQKKVKARTTRPTEMKRVESHEHMHGATLGVPSEPGQEFDELVDEVMEEIKKRRGSKAGPDGLQLKNMVVDSLKRNTGAVEDETNKKSQ